MVLQAVPLHTSLSGLHSPFLPLRTPVLIAAVDHACCCAQGQRTAISIAAAAGWPGRVPDAQAQDGRCAAVI